MLRFSCWIISILLLLAAGAAMAESLWTQDKSKSMFSDQRAYKIGDLLTVVIIETASSSQSASTDTKKDSSLSSQPGVGPLLKELPMFQFSNGDSMKAAGSTARSSNLTARMTVKVIKVDDGGNLFIEGMRDVQTNKEKAQMKLTGTIRPRDISQDNTILSTYIADAKIFYEGKGTIGSRQGEGFISRIFKILF